MTWSHIAEQSHFLPDFRSKPVLCTTYDDVRLHSALLEHLDGMLGRLGLQFLCRAEIWHQSKVDSHAVLFGKFPLELTHRLDERLGLHIAYGSSDFGDYDIILSGLAEKKHASFDFIGNMRDDLYCLAKIGSLPLLVDDGMVDLSCRYIVGLGCMHTEESLIMAEVKVSLGPVIGNIALSMFVRVECTRVDIDVRVEFLDSNPQTSGLKKFGQ